MVEDIKRLLLLLRDRRDELRKTFRLVFDDNDLISIDKDLIIHFNSLGKCIIHLENIINYYENDQIKEQLKNPGLFKQMKNAENYSSGDATYKDFEDMIEQIKVCPDEQKILIQYSTFGEIWVDKYESTYQYIRFSCDNGKTWDIKNIKKGDRND